MSEAESAPRRLERRWAPRYIYRADLEIEWGSAVLRANTRDISANGMFIESADPLWVGAGFTARLSLKNPVKIDCSVKRVEPGFGMAVALNVPDKSHHEEYLNLLNSLAAPRI
jgi:PilZ domain